jgi:outer membrane biosynthesis protein TonB
MSFSIGAPLSAMVLAVLLVWTTSSCRKKHAAVPVPSQPAAVQAPRDQPTTPATTAPATANPPQTDPAQTTPVTTPASPPKEESKYQKNKPPDQPPPPKRAAHPSNPAPAATAPQGAAPANVTPADPPRLGDILTPDQQHQYNAAIDVSLAHAQASLDFISTRQLSKEQQATVAEILNFMQQAQEKRKNDLAAAKSLAERAEVLSHDLVASLRSR